MDSVHCHTRCQRVGRKIYHLLACFVMVIAASFLGAMPPVMHFDASKSDTIAAGADASVTEWQSVCRIYSLVGAALTHDQPILHPAGINGMPALRFDHGHAPMLIRTTNLPDLQMGALHVFVVARLIPESMRRYILSMGTDPQSFNLFSDGRIFRLETGMVYHQRRSGPAVDRQVHLFEFAHGIDPALQQATGRTIWPGDFHVDGQLCGKLFNAAKPLPLAWLAIGGNPAEPDSTLVGDFAELIIYDRMLSPAQAAEIRSRLALKWGIQINPTTSTELLPRLTETRIGPANKHSSFGYFGESPESPDGSRIAYVVFAEGLTAANQMVPVDLWVCDHDFSNHRQVLANAIVTNLHNGAMTHWVDNHRIALGSNRDGEIIIVNADSGEIDFGPYSPGWLGGIGHQGQVLLHMSADSQLGPNGLYQLDTRSGHIQRLFAATDFTSFYHSHQWRGEPDPAQWRFVHGKFSPSGSRIGFAVVSGRGGSQHLFTANADGSDLRIWGSLRPDTGADKPLHWQWYDDQLIFGADQDSYDGTPNNLYIKKWDRNGNYIATLAGPGNHIAMSPDQRWFAGESFYFSNPVRLFLYRSGITQPHALVFEHHGVFPTWILSGHVNPAFSRDGSRVYYNRPVDNQFIQVYSAQFSQSFGSSMRTR